MNLADDIKPITYLKTHTAEAVEQVRAGRTLVITQHGEASAVLMSVKEYDELQRSLAMMRVVARGEEDVRAGRLTPHRQVLSELRERVKGRGRKADE